ncbi:MAG: hypothetical protein PHY62_05530 [Gallionella sp.]|nr:hypothetical protein [Gallionella sp.]
MFTKGFLRHDIEELALEVERHCLVLGLDCADQSQIRRFAHDLLQNIDTLREAAAKGDMNSRTKVELYGLVVLLHKANAEELGPNYLNQFSELAKMQPAWAAVAKAIWNELDSREAANQ